MTQRDWADDKADEIYSLMIACTAEKAKEFLAASLRLAHCEGESAGLDRAEKAMDRVFGKERAVYLFGKQQENNR